MFDIHVFFRAVPGRGLASFGCRSELARDPDGASHRSPAIRLLQGASRARAGATVPEPSGFSSVRGTVAAASRQRGKAHSEAVVPGLLRGWV